MIKAEWTNADALNLQPTCNQLATDCIGRQAAIDDIETVNPSMPLSVNWVKNWVKALPSAQPERKTGRWIDMNTSTLMYMPRYKCSICDGWANKSNFCPNCGAKMEVEHEAD